MYFIKTMTNEGEVALDFHGEKSFTHEYFEALMRELYGENAAKKRSLPEVLVLAYVRKDIVKPIPFDTDDVRSVHEQLVYIPMEMLRDIYDPAPDGLYYIPLDKGPRVQRIYQVEEESKRTRTLHISPPQLQMVCHHLENVVEMVMGEASSIQKAQNITFTYRDGSMSIEIPVEAPTLMSDEEKREALLEQETEAQKTVAIVARLQQQLCEYRMKADEVSASRHVLDEPWLNCFQT